jgi:hypothetical protein
MATQGNEWKLEICVASGRILIVIKMTDHKREDMTFPWEVSLLKGHFHILKA